MCMLAVVATRWLLLFPFLFPFSLLMLFSYLLLSSVPQFLIPVLWSEEVFNSVLSQRDR